MAACRRRRSRRCWAFVIAEVSQGYARFEMTPEFRHYNPIGVVHGGVAATLLDSCMGCAVQTHLPAGTGYTTLEIKINFVRALTDKTGPIRAEARTLHVGRRAGTAEGKHRRCQRHALRARHDDVHDPAALRRPAECRLGPCL